MKVIKANADNLASVLIISPKLDIFQDIWRHKNGLRVEILLDDYARFILDDENVLQFLSFKDIHKVKDYKNKSSPKSLYNLYPYFVRDVVLAQTVEIFKADKCRNIATEIAYISPMVDIKTISYKLLPKSCIMKGKYGIAEALNKQNVFFEINISEHQNLSRLEYCYATYGYSCVAIENNFSFTWITN